MKTQNHFVFAVMIAIIIPLAMGSIYFISIYNKRNLGENIQTVAFNDDVLILGNIEIKKIADSKFESMLVVKYPFGESEISDYSIYLKDINFDSTIDPKKIHWELFMLDEEDDTYLKLQFGNMEKIENGKLKISPNLQIGNGKTQKFRLDYYYETFEINKDYNFYAKIVLE